MARTADVNMERSARRWFGRFARRIGVRREQGAANHSAAGLGRPLSAVLEALIDERALAQLPGSSIEM
jgi:hypothetical protein